jgi:hypothetical protein
MDIGSRLQVSVSRIKLCLPQLGQHRQGCLLLPVAGLQRQRHLEHALQPRPDSVQRPPQQKHDRLHVRSLLEQLHLLLHPSRQPRRGTPDITIDGVSCPVATASATTSVTYSLGARLTTPTTINTFVVIFDQNVPVLQDTFLYVLKWSDQSTGTSSKWRWELVCWSTRTHL